MCLGSVHTEDKNGWFRLEHFYCMTRRKMVTVFSHGLEANNRWTEVAASHPEMWEGRGPSRYRTPAEEPASWVKNISSLLHIYKNKKMGGRGDGWLKRRAPFYPKILNGLPDPLASGCSLLDSNPYCCAIQCCMFWCARAGHSRQL